VVIRRREDCSPVRRHSLSFIAMLYIGIGTTDLYGSIACAAAAAGDPSREDRLRAGYLFNFAKFIEWPSFMAEEPLRVCCLRSPGIHAAFDASSGGKSIGSHRLVTRDVRDRPAAAGCRMVFVAAGVAADGEYSRSNITPAVVTIGDAPDFLERGGIIELFTQENRLRFKVSLDNARQAGLRIGSDLLQLAAQIEEKKQ